MVKFISANMRF